MARQFRALPRQALVSLLAPDTQTGEPRQYAVRRVESVPLVTVAGRNVDECGQRLDPRLVRHAEVFVAAAVHDDGTVVSIRARHELGHECGLADAGLAADEPHPSLPGACDLPGVVPASHLVGATGEHTASCGDEARGQREGDELGRDVDRGDRLRHGVGESRHAEQSVGSREKCQATLNTMLCTKCAHLGWRR